MRYFPRHQELQSIFAFLIIAKINQPLINDLGSRLGRYIASQIYVKFAGNFEVVGSPGIPH